MGAKARLQKKLVRFGAKEVTLWSLDGVTWSSRKDELESIKERQESQKVTAAHLRGEAQEAGREGAAAQPPAYQRPMAGPAARSKKPVDEPQQPVEEPKLRKNDKPSALPVNSTAKRAAGTKPPAKKVQAADEKPRPAARGAKRASAKKKAVA